MPTLIRAEGLTKYYRRPRRHEGAFGGLRTLITRQYDEVRAVDGVDFTVSDGELDIWVPMVRGRARPSR
ncbi:hypothetical protein STANM309S_03661 [Streptomyces tanashiensis]